MSQLVTRCKFGRLKMEDIILLHQ